MKKLCLLLCLCSIPTVYAANLIEVYNQAQKSDPIFQQAVSQRLATKQGVPISVAALLPTIQFTTAPSINRITYSGTAVNPVVNSSGTPNITQRGLTVGLSLTQTIFNFAQFSVVRQQLSLSKGADATLNAALQDLMVRVAKAYFTILNDEDNLSYAKASKLAYAEKLDQIKKQFKVGLKTITDVYTAEAAFDSAVATEISAETTLINDRENLRVMTCIYYSHLSALSDAFPLVTPEPQDSEQWVNKAIIQNWAIIASRYQALTAREAINQQKAGHLPSLDFQASVFRRGSETHHDDSNSTFNQGVSLNLIVPIFSGGAVTAQTRQAIYNYQVAQQQLEQTIRSVVNTTRQSYHSLVAGISQIKADKETIKSTISSLKGLELSYKVGTENLVDVLDQQQKVLDAQRKYAADRYAFVNNILALKQAAGTLSFNDLCAINRWLTDEIKEDL